VSKSWKNCGSVDGYLVLLLFRISSGCPGVGRFWGGVLLGPEAGALVDPEVTVGGIPISRQTYLCMYSYCICNWEVRSRLSLATTRDESKCGIEG
jgi:hypothetical protein